MIKVFLNKIEQIWSKIKCFVLKMSLWTLKIVPVILIGMELKPKKVQTIWLLNGRRLHKPKELLDFWAKSNNQSAYTLLE